MENEKLYLKSLIAKEIKPEFDLVHGTSAPVFATVCNRINEFKRGRTPKADEHRSGRSVDVSTPDMIDKIHDIVLNDWRIELHEIDEAPGVSKGTIISILHNKLRSKNNSARCGLRFLRSENKSNRVVSSEALLGRLRRNSGEYSRRLATLDETWVHHYTSETKEQSKQCIVKIR